MKDIAAIKTLLATPKKIVVTTHANPDADALGSSLGLGLFLKKLGHEVSVITPTEYPDFLAWMSGNEDVIAFSDANSAEVNELINAAEVIFCLDFSDLRRVGKLADIVAKSEAKKIIVDHHLNPADFADLMIHDTTAAATAELIYDMIVAFQATHLIDDGIANCLYAGIMTDTGSFKHSNTTAKVFRTVAALVEKGANTGQVSRNIYDNNSPDRLRFLGYALSELLQVDEVHHVAYFVITSRERDRFNLRSGDTEGLVNYALSLRGIQVAVLFKEHEGEIKMSFRSIGDIAVNKFAENNFSGGGHKNAAGGISYISLDETVKKFRELIESNVLGIDK